jgi:hypothetical protein
VAGFLVLVVVAIGVLIQQALRRRRRRRLFRGRIGAARDWESTGGDPWPRIVGRIRGRWPGQLGDDLADHYRAELATLTVGETERAVQSLVAGEGDQLPDWRDFRRAAQGRDE